MATKKSNASKKTSVKSTKNTKASAAKRKPSATAAAKKRKQKQAQPRFNLKSRLALTILAVLVVVVIAVFGATFYESFVPVKAPVSSQKSKVTVFDPSSEKTAQVQKPAGVPTPERGAEKTPPEMLPPPTPKTAGKPQLAIIIDDMGYDLNQAKKLEKLNVPITFSILPFSTYGKEIARFASTNIEIMVHVPMQAINGESDKAPGVLADTMTEAEIAATLKKDLAEFPNARGINNHTGSLLTQQLVPMQIVMMVVKEAGLFFVDSVTTDKSVAKSVAEMLLVPTISRDVFLDHEMDKAKIKAQLYAAVKIAKERGYAVVIGHPKDLTITVLTEELPKIKDVEFVKVSVLVK